MYEPKLIIDKIRDFIMDIRERSRIDGLEHGSTICLSPSGDILLTPELLSERDHGLLAPCPINTKQLGFVHTHPVGHYELSDVDITSGLIHDLEFVCVTTPDTDKVKCIVFNTEHPEFREFKDKYLTLYDKIMNYPNIFSIRDAVIKISELWKQAKEKNIIEELELEL